MTMTREDAAEILEEVKTNDDSMFAYNEPYMIAIDMAIDALKARETSLEKIASDYGLTVDGVRFALDQYQRVVCEITHSRMSKLSYYADDILRLANDLQCDGCDLKETRVLSLEELWDLPNDEDYNAPVCVEQRFPLDRWDGGSNVKWCSAGFVQEEYLDDNKYFNPHTYNITWRAWTFWPTKQHREATAWERLQR